jgi:hypothetical protein
VVYAHHLFLDLDLIEKVLTFDAPGACPPGVAVVGFRATRVLLIRALLGRLTDRPRTEHDYLHDSRGSAVIQLRAAFLVLGLAGVLAVTAVVIARDGGSASTVGSGPVTLRPVDGGPAYYARFPRSFPARASYFPIGVWLESVVSPDDVARDKRAGLNTYVGLTPNSRLPVVAAHGMKVVAQYEDWVDRANAPGSSAIAGWLLADEIDMQVSPREGFSELRSARRKLPPDDGRLVYNNFGKGVAFWNSEAAAARYVGEFQDVVSADTYWFTDGSICGLGEGGGRRGVVKQRRCHLAANYGWTVRRVRRLLRPAHSKPVWSFVEVGHPFPEPRWPSIRPAQVRAATWNGLIHGARGVIYFNHSFGGPAPTQHALREPAYAAVRSVVTKTNALIRRLAPVLNAPFADRLASTTGAIDTMAKYYRGDFYLFAGSRDTGRQSATFWTPCVGNGTVRVIDEDRTIPLSDGAFTDTFADGNAVHIYRLDGGSDCGVGAG